MNKVLVVLSHPHTRLTGFSMKVYKKFMETYRRVHPNDEIIVRDLFNQAVLAITDPIFEAVLKEHASGLLGELTTEERYLLHDREMILEEFMSADKYVFVNPMYNHFLPVQLKGYLDTVSVPRKTFKYTKEGPVGLMNNKKGLHIQAAGNLYHVNDNAKEDMGSEYLNTMLRFYGINDITNIFIEGTARKCTNNQELLQRAYQEAIAKAREF